MLKDPVSVAQYQGSGAFEAEATRAALEAAGIPAFTAGHDMGELVGWVRVFVSAGDRERAEAVIAGMEAARRHREAVEKYGVSVVRCLACHRPMTADRCRTCGWSWRDGCDEDPDE
jgi:hypothetical protein